MHARLYKQLPIYATNKEMILQVINKQCTLKDPKGRTLPNKGEREPVETVSSR